MTNEVKKIALKKIIDQRYGYECKFNIGEIRRLEVIGREGLSISHIISMIIK
jgi:hypothetical protein